MSFLCFLREDSLPLASEMLGEPGRVREEGLVEADGRGCLEVRFEGVLVPREEAPDEAFEALGFSRSEAVVALASSLRRSSALASSVSVSSDSLCGLCQ